MSPRTDSSPDPDPSPAGRRRGLPIAAATALVLMAIVGLLIASPWSDGSDAEKGSDATSTTQVGVDPRGPGAPVEEPGAETSTVDDSPAAEVPFESIPAGDASATCAAVVARLKEYSDAAGRSSVDQLEPLFQKLSEFEDQIFTYANGEAWGDQMVEKLVVIRRGWADAGSAAGRDETDEATAHAAAANEKLDELVANPPCP